jgi:hypothetical protein
LSKEREIFFSSTIIRKINNLSTNKMKKQLVKLIWTQFQTNNQTKIIDNIIR